ncbi:sensor histidine kinase [Paenibacillus solisilvae]|uniref:histidine kinase n=1 Tax=Paenibacillus solisilvae TaxID=2486751 RepID=A0ABW0VSV4_9BACL
MWAKIGILKVIGGMIFINVIILLCWSLSFTIVSYVKEKRNESGVTAEMVHDGKLLADMLARRDTSWTEGLNRIAEHNQYSFVVIDGKGAEHHYGSSGGNSLHLPKTSVQSVLSGGEYEEIKRSNIFKSGAAVVGVPLELDGRQAALFIQSPTPSLYRNYGIQLLTVFGGFVIMFIGMLSLRPWRREMGVLYSIIDAIRRMSKGDYTVAIPKNQKIRGQYGELVESINDMASELSQVEQMRQTFISNVSHEIQSPLTSIRGFARALQQGDLEKDQRLHYYNIIETESLRLSKLSDNLLKLTSLESDQHPFEPKPYRLDKQIRRMILACEPQWVEKDIMMDVDMDEVTLTADEDLMSQVWTNILANSIKFTPGGGIVSVEAKAVQDGVKVVISDNGTGISEEDLPHIFERFYMADKARNRTIGGSGLGLSIVKRIMDMHHSEIQVSSKRDIGTTFTLMLRNYKDEQTGESK